MSKALIVCESPKGADFYRTFLLQNDFSDALVLDSGEKAKRNLANSNYDICLIDAPLRDCNAIQLAIDIADKNICQVILSVKAEHIEEITEQVENFGIITVGKPLNRQLFWGAIKLAKVCQRRLEITQQENKKLQKKLEEMKFISRAKCLLIYHEGKNEEDAHKAIEQRAMNERMTKIEIAKEIIRTYE